MSFTILGNRKLSENVFQMDVEAPLVARSRKAGQFVIVSVDEDSGERIPLTISGADPKKGSIRLIYQRVGKATSQMAELKEGEAMGYIVGPLGKPTHIELFGTVVCVGGGIGNAPLLPIATALKEAGNKVISILGCSRDPKPDCAIAIGPAMMMKFCCETTKEFNVPTQVSLNTIMVDGTGMCGGCRVEVGGETKFVCVDGPEFDGHLVNFEQMMKRMSAYKALEQKALDNFKDHKCRIGLNSQSK
ncbi:MAG: sulfide/dihydroorotate dehydrogenase-like FAD/NAD-binding protein [Planctomycetota bacterium]|jgi:NAD(P)H-flavin reductase